MSAKRKRKRKLKKGFLVVSILISVLLILTVGVWAVINFVPNINILTVEKITVSGDDIYPADSVILASGINNGVTVLKLNFNKIEAKLEKELPYIKNAEISYSFNGELNINITSEIVNYSIKSENEYYLLNSEFKLLDKSSSAEGIIICGIDLLEEVELGTRAIKENSEKQNILKEIEDELDGHSINVEVIDIEDKNNILIVYSGRYIVEVGTDDLLEDKIKLLATIVKDLNDIKTGRILLKYWSNEDREGSVISESIEEYLNKY